MRSVSGRSQASIAPSFALWVATLLLGAGVTWAEIGAAQDQSVLRALVLRASQSPEWQIELAQWISWAGDAAQRSLVFIGCALWLFWKKRPRAGLIMLVVPALAGATSSILKQVFARTRPDVAPHLDSISNLSFPSGHATSAIAILLLAALLLPARRRTLWIGLAVIGAGAIGASRVLLGVHWPSDVLGGFLWGTGFALAGVAAARHWPDARR